VSTPPPPVPGGEARAALIAGVACYTLWGFLPLLFMALARAGSSPWEILAHRTMWSVLWAGLLVILASQGAQLWRVLRQPRTMAPADGLHRPDSGELGRLRLGDDERCDPRGGARLLPEPPAEHGRGRLFFRERIGRAGKIAIALAALGVLLQALALGRPPWISLFLAFSFCAYGIIRKRVKADAQTGLFVECLILALPGLLYVLWLERSGAGNFTDGPTDALLLLATGPATVIPLALFAWAARRLNLSTMGFLQFLAPTLQFMIGLLAGEQWTALRGVSFAFIWAGVAVFAFAAWRRHRTPELSPRLSAVQTQREA
jgi:chloramphenicol-sensitive protein RarD